MHLFLFNFWALYLPLSCCNLAKYLKCLFSIFSFLVLCCSFFSFSFFRPRQLPKYFQNTFPSLCVDSFSWNRKRGNKRGKKLTKHLCIFNIGNKEKESVNHSFDPRKKKNKWAPLIPKLRPSTRSSPITMCKKWKSYSNKNLNFMSIASLVTTSFLVPSPHATRSTHAASIVTASPET